MKFDDFGIQLSEILLPKDKDLKAWSVIACDQYTQDEEYWNKVRITAGEKPSTLNLILPEVYLSSSDKQDRIEKIRVSMADYINGDVFDSPEKEFIYVERLTGYGRTRKGLVCAIDLETYEWKPFSKALIRATEATIVDRIPPRKEIRKNAPLELPHIMLLVNDPEKLLVEKAGEIAKNNKPVYDSDLMMDAGHIKGWALKSEKELETVHSSLEQLKVKNTMEDGSVFMFAVGDGNHSLATAKAVWDEYKAESGVTDSPVRYALVEIVNIYDEGLTFEPIHRVIFGAYPLDLITFVADKLKGEIINCSGEKELSEMVNNSSSNIGFVFTADGQICYKCVKTQIKELAVSVLQPEIDSFIQNTPACEIDYIHGTDEVFRLGAKADAVSVMLPPVAKDSFFETISQRGPLPRKSFSMGEASEKRFYLECRKLFS